MGFSQPELGVPMAKPWRSPTQQPHLVTVPVHMARHIYHQALAAAYTWPW